MNAELISVVIPTYNRAKMVCDCVRSVLATKYPALEVIVVDDCSPDDTRERIGHVFGSDPRVKFVRNDKNSFQAVSRNNGRKLARGRYLFFLDDDNIVRPDILDELLAVFKAHPQAGLVAPMAVHQRLGRENVIWTLGGATLTAGLPRPGISRPICRSTSLSPRRRFARRPTRLTPLW